MASLSHKVYTKYTQAIHKLLLEPSLNIVRWSARNCSCFSNWPRRCGH